MTLLLALSAALAYPVSMTPYISGGSASGFDSCDAATIPCADHPLVGPYAATAWFTTSSGGTTLSSIGVNGGSANTAAPGLAFSMGRLYVNNAASGWADDSGTDVINLQMVATLSLADGSTGQLTYSTGIEYFADMNSGSDLYRMTGGSFQTRSLTHAGYRYDLTFSLFGLYINETFAGPSAYYYLYYWMDNNFSQSDWARVFDGSSESWQGVWSGRQVAVLTARAGADQLVEGGETVTLMGGGSGDPASYAWRQLSGPPVVLSDTSSATPSFTAPHGARGEVLTFELTTTGSGLLRTDTVRVEVLPCDDVDRDGVCDATADCPLLSLAPRHGRSWPAADDFAVWSATGVTGTGRVDGSLAAGGVVSLQDARVGRGDALLVSAADVLLRDTIVGGDVIAAGWIGQQGSTRVRGSTTAASETLPIATETSDRLLDLAWELSEAPVTGEVLRRSGRVLQAQGTGTVVHVVLDGAELTTASELRIRAAADATVLLEVGGDSVVLGMPIVLDGPAADHVLLLAPDATSLRLATDVPFAVLAPAADVVQRSGTVTGGVYAWSVAGELDVVGQPRFGGACAGL